MTTEETRVCCPGVVNSVQSRISNFLVLDGRSYSFWNGKTVEF